VWAAVIRLETFSFCARTAIRIKAASFRLFTSMDGRQGDPSVLLEVRQAVNDPRVVREALLHLRLGGFEVLLRRGGFLQDELYQCHDLRRYSGGSFVDCVQLALAEAGSHESKLLDLGRTFEIGPGTGTWSGTTRVVR